MSYPDFVISEEVTREIQKALGVNDGGFAPFRAAGSFTGKLSPDALAFLDGMTFEKWMDLGKPKPFTPPPSSEQIANDALAKMATPPTGGFILLDGKPIPLSDLKIKWKTQTFDLKPLPPKPT